MPERVTLARVSEITFAPLSRAWSRIWFQDAPTSPLEIARIGIGAAMLHHYAVATPYLNTFWGDDGWVPKAILTDNTSSSWVPQSDAR
jgi:hypothetical protein